MLFYYKNKNVGSVTTSHTPTFIVEPEKLRETLVYRWEFKKYVHILGVKRLRGIILSILGNTPRENL